MKRKQFARKLKYKYGNDISSLMKDFEYFSQEKTGSLSHCSIFLPEIIFFVFLIVVTIGLIVFLSDSYSIVGWFFVIGIFLVATAFRTKWEVNNQGLKLVSPIFKRVKYIDEYESSALEIDSSNFKLKVKLKSGSSLVFKDGSLSNVYSLYVFFLENGKCE